MAMSLASEGQSTLRGSFFERAIAHLLMRPARVTDTMTLSAKFRLIDLDSEGLKGCACSPGDKIQVKFDGGVVARTYTPMMLDSALGRTRILAYSHGAGPGSEWARAVAVGDDRQILGPRNSLDLESLASPTVVFGDETAFGLAAAIQRSATSLHGLHFVFEVNALPEALVVLDAVGVVASAVIERRPDQSHLAEVTQTILRITDDQTTFVLSGRAPSIRHVAGALKGKGVATRRLKTKAYWAPGKVGLD
jgi:ferric-chelate reductase (NADPH)